MKLEPPAAAPIACEKCAAPMEKTTHVKKDFALQLLGIVVFLIGLGLCFAYFPIGIIAGLALMILAARMGHQKLKVWKCSKCGYFFERLV